mgnify:CR=1 FL=1
MDVKQALVATLIISACSDNSTNFTERPDHITPIETDFSPITLDELGVPTQVDQRLEYSSFEIGYRFNSKQAAWSGYALQPELVRVINERKDSFKIEPLLPVEHRATLNDYIGSGYQRGHLAPNATLDHSEESMVQTFYLSNISPQTGEFNTGDWLQLENFVRACVDNYADGERVFVFTGPYFAGKLDAIGDSKLPVPTGFYKIMYEFNNTDASAIAFIAPHENFNYNNLENFLRSIDFIESITGLDFAENIPDELEALLESTISPVCELPKG